jgi:hypothetical protein
MMKSGLERKQSAVRRTSLGKLAVSMQCPIVVGGMCVGATDPDGTLRYLPGQISRPPQVKAKPVVDMADK